MRSSLVAAIVGGLVVWKNKGGIYNKLGLNAIGGRKSDVGRWKNQEALAVWKGKKSEKIVVCYFAVKEKIYYHGDTEYVLHNSSL
jgi:hypothetical protein